MVGLLLCVQFVLLTCVLFLGVVYGPASSPIGLMTGATSMIAVCAMACQFALLRLAVPGAPSTAVMTGNLTNAVFSLLDTVSRIGPLMGDAEERLRRTSKLLVGFFVGCVAGAALVSVVADWAWSLPVVLAAPRFPDQHHVPHIGLGEKILDQIERCRIEPL